MNVSFPYPLSSKYSKTLELVYECVCLCVCVRMCMCLPAPHLFALWCFNRLFCSLPFFPLPVLCGNIPGMLRY